MSPDAAVATVEPGMRVRFPCGHNSILLGDHLAARAGELSGIEVVHTGSNGAFLWLGTGFEADYSVVHEHWASPSAWPMMKERRADYLAMPMSLRFKAERDGRPLDEQRHCDVACIQVSPPDANGMVNLGRYVWDAPDYIRSAGMVLAEIVPNMPIMRGDGNIPVDAITYFVEGAPMPAGLTIPAVRDERNDAIARLVATLINDGDTLQIGAGTATFAIIGALTEELRHHNDLGWHSELMPPRVSQLIRDGVLTSKRVALHPGVAVSGGFASLAEEADVLDDNPAIQAWEIKKVVDPRVVSSIPNFKAINTAIMIDLTGQMAAETIGTEMHGGTGGLLELVIGSLWSDGGRPITALPSTDRSGTRSRVVPTLPAGTQGTVPRTLVDTVVTEHGIAHLWGKTVRERADALTAVAAPQFRDELEAATRRLYYP